jgi:hypothetical protein
MPEWPAGWIFPAAAARITAVTAISCTILTWNGPISGKGSVYCPRKRSAEYLAEVEVSLAEGRRPVLMCPLNESGLCRLYAHRLMICRMHGVPSSLTLPDGRRLSFPGCFRCQEILGKPEGLPTVDRTALYRELAALEAELLGPRKNLRPKVKMTIAQMIVQGPPQV